MAKKKSVELEPTQVEQIASALPANITLEDLVRALSDIGPSIAKGIEQSRPTKITAANRKPRTFWNTDKDGKPIEKVKPKRKYYQHSLLIDTDMLHNEHLELLNKLKPGRYFDGHVVVRRRRDKGIDIDYPIKTQSQHMKMASLLQTCGFTGRDGFEILLKRCVAESEDPRKYTAPEDLD